MDIRRLLYILLAIGIILLVIGTTLPRVHTTYTPTETTYNPVRKPVIVVTFTQTEPIVEPVIETTPEPTIIPIVEFIVTPIIVPTVEPTIVIDPIVESTIEPVIKPTYHTPYLLDREEVQRFMLQDQTDLIPYTSDFMCGSFAHTVINNAWELGIVGRYTVVWSPEWSLSHAIIQFPTVNDGNVYVDATAGDYWAYPEGNIFYTISMRNPNMYGFTNVAMTGFITYYEYGK